MITHQFASQREQFQMRISLKKVKAAARLNTPWTSERRGNNTQVKTVFMSNSSESKTKTPTIWNTSFQTTLSDSITITETTSIGEKNNCEEEEQWTSGATWYWYSKHGIHKAVLQTWIISIVERKSARVHQQKCYSYFSSNILEEWIEIKSAVRSF